MLIVRKLRLQRGWSQAELAQFSGLSVRTIQRIERGEKPGLETLKSLAAVFDMEVSDFHIEEEDMNGVTSDEKQAMEYVKDLKGFYISLIVYVLVISGLFTINLLTYPDYIWAKWPAIGWGFGILISAFRIFGGIRIFSADWERRQVEKRLGRHL
jgi:transcriptional regulator with XRE-family HTH domain